MNKNVKLNFFSDKQRDSELLKSIYLDKKNLADTIWPEIEKNYGEINDKNIDLYVSKLYQSYGHFIEKTSKLYQNSWDEINDKFFELINKKTKLSSHFPVYDCHVTAFFHGLASWGNNVVVRGWRENPFTMRKITAHEILIAYLWNHLRDIFLNDTEHKLWEISELIAWVMLSYDEDFIKFWPWFIDRGGLQNYPKLATHIYETKEVYFSTKDFKDFLLRVKGII
ncbi:MAG: hypothetical protein UU20_C0054G0001, partial [Parcubacteria group bacterium GW2011_GWE2_40_8]